MNSKLISSCVLALAVGLVAFGGYALFSGKTGTEVLDSTTQLAKSAVPKMVEPLPIAVQVGDRWGYIDKTGKFVINLQFEWASFFDNDSHLALVMMGGKLGLIDTTGRYVVNPQFDFVAILADERGKIFGTNDVEIPPDNVSFFGDGLLPVRLDHKWGFIDKTGKYVINPQFDDATPFADGLARVKLGGKWGFIDKTGKLVIPPQFDLAFPFKDGLAPVTFDGKWGFIDKAGKLVINPQFNDVGRELDIFIL